MTTHPIDHRTKVLTPPATSEPEEKTKALASAYEGPFSRLEHHIEHLAARARRDRPARRRLDGIPRHLRCAYQETIRTADGNVIQMYYTHAAGPKPKTTPGDPPY